MTNPFAFLRAEWPEVFDAASRSASLVHRDARAACFYSRRALELAIGWLYKHDPALKLPYQDNLSALIHEPTFKTTAGEAVFNKARVITTLGNRAVHGSRPIPLADAVASATELFHVSYWLARTYGRGAPPVARPQPSMLRRCPKSGEASRQTAEQLRQLQSALRERDEKLSSILSDHAALDAELVRLRAEVAAAREAAHARPDTHDYSESQTRDYFIDLLLKEAGWPLDQPRDREFEVARHAQSPGDGLRRLRALGRRRQTPRVGRGQAHASGLPRRATAGASFMPTASSSASANAPSSSTPTATTTGSGTTRVIRHGKVQGFYRKTELDLIVQRRASRKELATAGQLHYRRALLPDARHQTRG